MSLTPTTGAVDVCAYATGEGDVCGVADECNVFVRNGATLSESDSIHSSHRLGHPL